MSNQKLSDQKLSIVYFGSGPLAAVSLSYLHRHFSIEAVITKPRAPHHKGAVPVIEFCQAQNIRIFTPASRQELTKLFAAQPFISRMGVVIDYGIIIDQDVIDAFALGIVNSHFSLLPQWRGADPITFAILSGQPKTGVSLMLIDAKMDEGPLLAQAECDITTSTTATSLTSDLVDISNALLNEILPLYATDTVLAAPQTNSIAEDTTISYSRKLAKADGVLDWQKPATQLEREVRAFIEWPKSRTTLGSIDVIITAAHATPSTTPKEPGYVEVIPEQDVLMVNTSNGYFCIDRLKPAGKTEMTAADFIRGYGSRLKD